MYIMGGKHLLAIKEPKVIYEYCCDTKKCKEILKNPTLEKIFREILIEDEEQREWKESNYHIWIGENDCQVLLTGRKDNLGDPDENGELNFVDINVVGDASPSDTLWFVFDESEWNWVGRAYGPRFIERVKDAWEECSECCENSLKNNGNIEYNNWALNELNGRIYDNYRYCRDIVQAYIEVNE